MVGNAYSAHYSIGPDWNQWYDALRKKLAKEQGDASAAEGRAAKKGMMLTKLRVRQMFHRAG